ncbi:MAG: hypothetical protein LBK63_05160, partial [Treponema sp.]|nr:hypothetical protein [Treponema sp.]
RPGAAAGFDKAMSPLLCPSFPATGFRLPPLPFPDLPKNFEASPLERNFPLSCLTSKVYRHYNTYKQNVKPFSSFYVYYIRL